MAEPVLETSGLSRRFGALLAVNAVTLEVARGSVHALIGPNGAGKSTLINLLSGELQPSKGVVRFRGRDITGLSADRIARLGIGRSFQRTNIYPSFTCFENCWIAVQSRLSSSLRFFRPADRLSDVRDRAERALATCGLRARRDHVAGNMSYGEQRQLELGMLLATESELLLLDEPLAGMGQEEAAAVTALLRGLAGERTLLLVEHDMDAVFAIADRVTVMVNGAVLETGSAEEVRASEAVQEAYLGFEDEEALP